MNRWDETWGKIKADAKTCPDLSLTEVQLEQIRATIGAESSCKTIQADEKADEKVNNTGNTEEGDSNSTSIIAVGAGGAVVVIIIVAYLLLRRKRRADHTEASRAIVVPTPPRVAPPLAQPVQHHGGYVGHDVAPVAVPVAKPVYAQAEYNPNQAYAAPVVAVAQPIHQRF